LTQPDDRTVSQVRHPVAEVLLDGKVARWSEWSVNQTGNCNADTFHVTLPVRLLRAGYGLPYWATAPQAEIEIRAGFADDEGIVPPDLPPLIIGEVDNVEHDLQGRTLTLTGRDYSSRFLENKTSEKFQNQTSSQIAAFLAARRGLAHDPGAITATTTKVGRYYEIDNARLTSEQSEWDLLTFLAQQEQFDVWVRGDNLYFQPPRDPAMPTYDLEWNEPTEEQTASGTASGLHFTRDLTVAKDIIVKIHSWNQKQQKGFTKAFWAPKLAGRNAAPHGVGHEVIDQSGNRPDKDAPDKDAKVYSYTIPNLTPDQALREAERRATEFTRHELVLSGSLPGDLTLDPRSVVRLLGVDQWNGIYRPDSVSRHYSLSNGFTMQLRAKNHPSRIPVPTVCIWQAPAVSIVTVSNDALMTPGIELKCVPPDAPPAGADWKINWLLNPASTVGGWIVQEISGTIVQGGDAKDILYWEAWEVAAGSSTIKLPPRPQSWGDPPLTDDTFHVEHKPPTGSATIKASARFYEGLTLPPSFTLNNSTTFAGGGYSTTEDPHLPLDNASNEKTRDWSTQW
jgi:hypothetical protein